MTRRLGLLVAVVLPVLAVGLSACARGPSEEAPGDDPLQQRRKAEAARPDVLRLADSLNRDEDEIERQADAIAETHDLGSVMSIFKLPDQPTVIVGKPGTARYDWIELKLLVLGKKPPSARDIVTCADDMKGMTDIIRAVAAVTPRYAKKCTKNSLEAKRWNELCGDMAKASDDLTAAIEQGDARTFKKAVNYLNYSCNECHTKFRDN